MGQALLDQASARWQALHKLQEEYAEFDPFLIDCMEDLMGFKCTDIQVDIGAFLQHGPQYLMIQAQRSQAKSSIVAIYSVWCLIHDPSHRVLILSAGSDVAQEIANWVIQIIMNWDILECIRPDRQHGDRASSKAFDVNWQLKGTEKSPSVACIGVTANMQGRRADLLIPDDIESSKNGLTEVQREHLQHLSKDFTSICQNGRIAYLGTPQTSDSIYNALPGRGYTIRIWPGRYPNQEQLANYGDHLAPLIRRRIIFDPTLQQGGGPLGDQGKPIDPILLPEGALTKKEIDQGTAYFQLQHMLNTKLMDKDRFPLKPRNLINLDLNLDRGPGKLEWMPDPSKRLKLYGMPDKYELYGPYSLSQDLYDYEGRIMYVDPAGGGANGDETVATVSYFLHGYVFIMEQVALRGGFDEHVFESLSTLALRHMVNKVDVEENFGKGMFAQMWRPILLSTYRDKGHSGAPQIEDVWETGQKELRIIDTLEPVIGRHRLIINNDVWRQDMEQAQRYPVDLKTTYMLISQLSMLSRERNALVHDDRVDSLAGAVRPWLEYLSADEDRRMGQKATDANLDHMMDWVTGSPEYHEAEASKRSVLPKVGIAKMGVLNQRNRRKQRHGYTSRQVLHTSPFRRH